MNIAGGTAEHRYFTRGKMKSQLAKAPGIRYNLPVL